MGSAAPGRGMLARLVSSPTCLESASRWCRGWEIAVEAEGGEGAMDVAAGADALDDLLAEVAAFGEVKGAGLGGLLGEFLVADVGAVEGCAFEEAEPVVASGVAGTAPAAVRVWVRAAMVAGAAQSSNFGTSGRGRG